MSRLAYPELKLLIAGRWVAAAGHETVPVEDPATGETLANLPIATEAEIDEALDAAARSQWSKVDPLQRSRVLQKAADLLWERRESLAANITYELGKPMAESLGEIEVARSHFQWAAEEARRGYGRIIPGPYGDRRLALREPLGVIAAFTPWNAPVISPSRKLSGALAAGCPVVLKAAEETPAGALAVAAILEEAGVPAGTVSVVFGNPSATAERMIAHPAVQGVTFTGSTAIGKVIAGLCAQGLKRATLELGGHSPVVIWKDADIERVCDAVVPTKYRNSGQVCVAPTRFYVHDEVYEPFRDLFVERARARVVGNGFDKATQMGPLANGRRIAAMEALTADARDRGVTVAAGGERVGNKGHFFQPTVMTEVDEDMRAMNEEPFGPVALLAPISSLDEAIARSNRLQAGLAAYVVSNDARVIRELTDGLQAGNIGVNSWRASVAETPFGGWKESGLGLEGGVEGLQEFQAVKSVLQS